ncbi:MAG: hypothetical protein WBD47_22535 [Phormidesmis sp.]
MIILLAEGAAASTFSGATAPYALHGALLGSGYQPPGNSPAGHPPSPEHVRHMLFGTPQSVQTTIKLLHKLGYAGPNDWSRLMSTGRAGEVMAILTRRVSVS